jgi:Peptidase family M1 domain
VKCRAAVLAAAWMAWGIAVPVWGQASAIPAPQTPQPVGQAPVASAPQAQAPPILPPFIKPGSGPAESLYFQLSTVGLDQSRVYHIRDFTLDRSAVHITFEDGTIAFTKDVAGRVTGAFFEGEGEVLLQPPNRVERASMALFTGSAILEEHFITAYFRFNDDTFAELQSALRPADNAQEFVSEWDETARNLAPGDALRLLMTFSLSLPVAGEAVISTPLIAAPAAADDALFHAYLRGRRLGTFDVHLDCRATEQIWAGQARSVESGAYFDTWTSFSPLRAAGEGVRAAGPGADKSGDQTGDRADDITVPSYRIRTQIKLPKSISGEAVLQVVGVRAGERMLLFELSRFLQVDRVEANGNPVEYIHNPSVEGTQLARRGNDAVAVVLPRPLRVGQRIELRFVYHGDVLSEAGGGLLYVGARGTWFPNRNFAMSNFDLEFRYPAGWTLLATGKRVDQSQEQNIKNDAAPSGEQVSRWVSERPMPVAGFNLGRYRRATAHAGKITVETYAALGVEESFPKPPVQLITPGMPLELGRKPQSFALQEPLPPSPARNAQSVADTSARAVEFFSRLYGPFPYSELALAQNPGVMSQGWPGLVFLSSYSFLTDAEKSQLRMEPVERTLSNNVAAHETAHQWWGDLVGWKSYHDQWIVEALANYSSLMLLETTDPHQFQAVLEKYRDNLLEKNKNGEAMMDAGPVTLGARLSSSHFPDGYDAISYGRGTWLLHMLRCMMRDAQPGGAHAPAGQEEPFVRALRKLREQNEEKEITTRDLLHAFEEELPRPLWHEGHKTLDWFYDGWVNGTAIPRFDLHNLRYTDGPGGTVVAGTLSQKDAPEDLVTAVPVYAVVGSKNILLGRVFVDGPEAPFHLSAPRGTRKVVVDPNQTLLARR